MFSKKAIKLAKPCIKAIKVLAERQGKQWEWEAKVGEWCLKDGEVILISGIIECPLVFGKENYRLEYLSLGKIKEIFVKDVTPLLHWERIISPLRDLGYGVFVETQSHNCRATISRDGVEITRKIGEDSQSAVIQAVIELRKED